MGAAELLEQLQACGVSVAKDGDELVLRPGGKVPPDLLDEVRRCKGGILDLLDRPVGDGQAPPLDRPPSTEQELRRLIDHLADPEAFARWLENLMQQTDPAEMER